MPINKTVFKVFCFSIISMILLAVAAPAQAASPARKSQINGSLNWAKNMGGAGAENVSDMALDSSSNVYTVGLFDGTADFDPGAGTANLTSAGSYDIYISKLDGNGNFVWAKRIGGTSQDTPNGVAVDSSNNIYITGSFYGTADFDPGAGIANLVSAGNNDIFICKLTSNGVFVWAKRIGGTGYDNGNDITLDVNGNVYTTGNFSTTADFDPNAGIANLTSVGNGDIFVSKLTSSGGYLWAKNMGGTGADNSAGIFVDSASNVYTTGIYEGTADFDPSASIANLSSVGADDTFISKLNGSGNFVWAKSMGGAENDHANDIAVDASGNVYTAGRFGGTADFNPGAGIANLTSAGFDDFFLSKLDVSGNYVWAKRIGGTGYDTATSIVLDSIGNIYTTGSFDNTVDFDPGAGIFNLTTAGVTDIFVSKLNNSGGFVWAKRMGAGGANYDYGEAIVLNTYGGLFAAGTFQGVADFDPGAATLNLTSLGGQDIFVLKLDNIETTTLLSVAVQDGIVLESAENSSIGGTMNNVATTFNLGDDAAKRQFVGILSFTTGASLPDNAVITAVSLKIKQQSIVGGGNPVTAFQGFMIDVKTGFFATFPALQAADFQAAADSTVGPLSLAPASGFYSINLTGAKAFINKTAAGNGLTQIRLRFKLDDDNNAVANYLSLSSGEALSVVDLPKLAINYYVP